jgi:protein TonB
MLLLTVGLHVAVLGLVLLNRPAPPPEIVEPGPSPPPWSIPTSLPGAPPPGGGGGHPRPDIIKLILPSAVALIESPAEAAPEEQAPSVDEAPPVVAEATSDGNATTGDPSESGDETAGRGNGGGHGDHEGPGNNSGSPGPPGVGGPDTVSDAPRVLSSDVDPPRLVHRVDPEVPLSLLRPPRDASVKLRCVIERNGSVRVLNVLSDPSRVQREAVEAVERWRYEPARSEGRPISVFLTVEVSFRAR